MSGKILIVDDELSIRELIKFNLEKAGFSVLESGDGAEALQLVKTHKPELLVLDLMLPGLDEP
jgi:two-component system alkaline phosphatase synthesis response regulator PhoP